jgi:hypothetical protein
VCSDEGAAGCADWEGWIGCVDFDPSRSPCSSSNAPARPAQSSPWQGLHVRCSRSTEVRTRAGVSTGQEVAFGLFRVKPIATRAGSKGREATGGPRGILLGIRAPIARIVVEAQQQRPVNHSLALATEHKAIRMKLGDTMRLAAGFGLPNVNVSARHLDPEFPHEG